MEAALRGFRNVEESFENVESQKGHYVAQENEGWSLHHQQKDVDQNYGLQEEGWGIECYQSLKINENESDKRKKAECIVLITLIPLLLHCNNSVLLN